MIDFTVLQFLWWGIVGLTMVCYATTAGFDLGSTMILPFIKNENEQRVMLNASGRMWDGNQTWLVFFGGAIFVVYPVVYATTFSGMYAAILCVLWAFFLRPPGYDYRSKIDSAKWRRMWDVGLFVSSFLPALIFGVAMGNLFVGLPIQFDPFSLRTYYMGNFWGLLNWMGILAGLTSVLMLLMHGAAMLHRRTEGDLKRRMGRLFVIFTVLFLIVFTGAGLYVAFGVNGYHLVTSPVNPTLHPLSNVVTQSRGAWIASYVQYPWKAAGPLIAYAFALISLFSLRVGKGGFTFWCSVATVAGTVLTAGLALFPFLVPSSIMPAQSLTVWDATSAHYTLNSMFYVSMVLFAIILLYKVFSYSAVWRGKGTLSVEDVKDNEHTFY
jgi:cytochrome bd ubiquinol oxidase subunit II